MFRNDQGKSDVLAEKNTVVSPEFCKMGTGAMRVLAF